MARVVGRDCPSEMLRALIEEHNKVVRALLVLLPTEPCDMPREIDVRQN